MLARLFDTQSYLCVRVDIGIRKLLNELSIIKRDKVLDLGCGEGLLIRILTKRSSMVVGIDLSVDRIREASRKCFSASFVRCDGAWLPFRNASFDKIICTEVLEHIRNDQIVVDEMDRVLRDYGTIGISAPNKTFFQVYNFPITSLLKKMLPIRRGIFRRDALVYGFDKWLKINGHVRYGYTEETMKSLLKCTNLHIVKCFCSEKGIVIFIWELVYNMRFGVALMIPMVVSSVFDKFHKMGIRLEFILSKMKKC